MTESELIKHALAEFASAADVYEKAKQKVASLVTAGVFVVGAAKKQPEKWAAVEKSDSLNVVVERMVTGKKRGPKAKLATTTPAPEKKRETKRPEAESTLTGAGLETRIREMIDKGGQWTAAQIANQLGLKLKHVSNKLSELHLEGAIIRVSHGLYQRAPAKGAPNLSPREKLVIGAGQINGESAKFVRGGEPTAEERVLAALGGGPKKFSELLNVCSLSHQGCSDALRALGAAGKVTSYNGQWLLQEVA
jgi:predicted Rossmann fold nucleotide-binding protein DprA/Smf involved in DNA uptake